MTLPIDQDVGRFRKIVRGKVRENLRKYMSSDKLVGRSGKGGVITIPIPQIDLPRFKYGSGEITGVGRGKGKPGDRVGDGPDKEGSDQAGNEPGEHSIDVELTIEELAEILGDELQLPRIQPKSNERVFGQSVRYNSIRRSGPEALRHPKRTFLTALKRQLVLGTYDPDHPIIIPIPDDKRYRSWKVYPRPDNNVVMFYVLDISGSMNDMKKRLVRRTCYWANIWIRAHYQNVVERYIAHDVTAEEVDHDTFYRINTAGGTHLSSGLRLSADIIRREYDPTQWNIYVYQFTDGENWEEDNDDAKRVLVDDLLPVANAYCYAQVAGWYYGKSFIDVLAEIKGFDNLIMARIGSDADVATAIKQFLGRGM
jgi:uncharacterized sporulation protein YeaH/YhbH (DUF444 family)